MGFQHPFFATHQTLLKFYDIPHLCNRCSTNTISITNNTSSTRCNTSRCITNVLLIIDVVLILLL